ncbi:hypothetical protein LXL04_026415 [Taraxacum kok-saghyz]
MASPLSPAAVSGGRTAVSGGGIPHSPGTTLRVPLLRNLFNGVGNGSNMTAIGNSGEPMGEERRPAAGSPSCQGCRSRSASGRGARLPPFALLSHSPAPSRCACLLPDAYFPLDSALMSDSGVFELLWSLRGEDEGDERSRLSPSRFKNLTGTNHDEFDGNSGPTINSTTNNNVVVNVRNKLDEDLLLTWAGVQQKRSSEISPMEVGYITGRDFLLEHLHLKNPSSRRLLLPNDLQPSADLRRAIAHLRRSPSRYLLLPREGNPTGSFLFSVVCSLATTEGGSTAPILLSGDSGGREIIGGEKLREEEERNNPGGTEGFEPGFSKGLFAMHGPSPTSDHGPSPTSDHGPSPTSDHGPNTSDSGPSPTSEANFQSAIFLGGPSPRQKVGPSPCSALHRLIDTNDTPSSPAASRPCFRRHRASRPCFRRHRPDLLHQTLLPTLRQQLRDPASGDTDLTCSIRRYFRPSDSLNMFYLALVRTFKLMMGLSLISQFQDMDSRRQFATGIIWSRYSMVITPKNGNLFCVNVAMAGTGFYQLFPKIRHDYFNEYVTVTATATKRRGENLACGICTNQHVLPDDKHCIKLD